MSGFDLHMDVDTAGLQRAFAEAPGELADALVDAVDESAARLQRDWRSNARKTARSHGKRYVRSITHTTAVEAGAVTADIGPESAMPQGGMGAGFEYGGVNQPPHMDGAAAFARNAQPFARRVDDAIDKVARSLE